MWLLLCLSTWPLWPPASGQDPIRLSPPEYIADSTAPLFVGQIQEAVYKLGRHCPLPPKRRLILLGASGSRGFDPVALASASAADETLNLSVVLSNVTQIRQVFDDLQVCLGDDGMHRSSFVLILSMGNFTSNGRRNEGPYTDYETEKLRSRLFTGEPGQLRPVPGREALPIAMELWRPVLLARKLSVEVREVVWESLQGLPFLGSRSPAMATEGATALDSEWSLRIISGLQPELASGAPYAPEQTQELDRLIERILESGSRVVLVEQPTQAWLRERSPAYAAAHQTLLAAASRHAVPYIDLSQSAVDEEFHDAMHANRQGTAAWSARLAQALADLQLREPLALGAAARATPAAP